MPGNHQMPHKNHDARKSPGVKMTSGEIFQIIDDRKKTKVHKTLDDKKENLKTPDEIKETPRCK